MQHSLPIHSIGDVVQRQLCSGCGACASLEPKRFRIGDAYRFGRRPFLVDDPASETGDALQACPGARLEHTFDTTDANLIAELTDGWGPTYEVWEGYAADQQIRFAGSSGGAATALAVFCIEQRAMSGVLHIAAQTDRPYLNQTVFSTTRETLLERTGSRYAPASPCDSLHLIEEADQPCVFIGKPCDVAAVSKARQRLKKLNDNLGLTIAFFCAGTPSTEATLDLLQQAGVPDPDSVRSLRYRGNGWPGKWTVDWTDRDGVDQQTQISYADSWGALQRYRQWRCYLCPDHTGEFADIAVGDPWYRAPRAGEIGKSLLVARTRLGREILHAAAKAGYLKLETSDPSLLPRSQPNLLATRGSLWARLRVLEVMGAATPKYRGFELFRFWGSALSIKQKLQSVTGTVRRVFRRRLRQRVVVNEHHHCEVHEPI